MKTAPFESKRNVIETLVEERLIPEPPKAKGLSLPALLPKSEADKLAGPVTTATQTLVAGLQSQTADAIRYTRGQITRLQVEVKALKEAYERKDPEREHWEAQLEQRTTALIQAIEGSLKVKWTDVQAFSDEAANRALTLLRAPRDGELTYERLQEVWGAVDQWIAADPQRIRLNAAKSSYDSGVQDDALYREAAQKLGPAQEQRLELGARLTNYRYLEAAVTGTLDKLTAQEAKLDPVTPVSRAKYWVVRAAGDNISNATKLLENLKSQVAALEQLRDVVNGLDETLELLIRGLKASVQKADRQLAAAKTATLELIKNGSTKDPNAAAERWLDPRTAEATAHLLAAANFSRADFIDHLLADHSEGPKTQRLRERLDAALQFVAPN